MALREPWRGAGGSSGDTEKKGGLEMEYGILGIIVLILDIYALVKTWQSAVSTGAKLLWTLLIVVLPVIGFIIWLIAGPKGAGRVNGLTHQDPHSRIRHRAGKLARCFCSGGHFAQS